MKKGFLLAILVLLAGMALCSHAVALDVPLPKDILIIPPDPNLPPEIKAFSGKWGGRWWSIYDGYMSLGGLDAVLIVEQIINERQAIVIYCWGDSLEWYTKRGCRRFMADFSQNEKETILSFFISNRYSTKTTFRVKGNKLEATHPMLNITMERIP